MYEFDKSISLDKTSSKGSVVPQAVAVGVLFTIGIGFESDTSAQRVNASQPAISPPK